MNYLHELNDHLHFDQLVIPKDVLDHDGEMVKKYRPGTFTWGTKYLGKWIEIVPHQKTISHSASFFFLFSSLPPIPPTLQFLTLSCADKYDSDIPCPFGLAGGSGQSVRLNCSEPRLADNLALLALSLSFFLFVSVSSEVFGLPLNLLFLAGLLSIH